MSHEKTIEGREVRREVLRLALPVTVSYLLHRMVTAVDIFLVGGLGAPAVAAVGLGQLLVFVSMTVVWGLSTGTMVAVAQRWGADRRTEAGRIAVHGLVATLILTVPLAAAGMAFAAKAAGVLGAHLSVQVLTQEYCRWVFLAFPATALVHVLTSTMHGAGDTRTPMRIYVILNLFHISLAIPLIYGYLGLPALGVQGAAVAVACAEVLGVLLLWWQGWAKGYLAKGGWALDRIRPVLHIGWPVAMDRMMWQAGQAVYAKILLLYGTAAFATHQLGVNVEALSFMPGLAIGVAAATVVGQSVGRGNVIRARLGMVEANRLGILFMGGMGVVFFLFPAPLLHLFTADEEVIRLGIIFLRIAALSQIPLAATLVLQGALRGAGDTQYILGVTILGIWGVRIPLAAAAAWWGLGVAYVWWAFLMDWVVRMVLVQRRCRSSRWERKDVLKVAQVALDPVVKDR
ncbi:MAG: MATE family efflux transporter [candidate division NC10 bacterium]|nr:MATE family efflux transporter [candidate division NC10 bacterium]